MPPVFGLTQSQAQKEINQAGLKIARCQTETSQTVPVGRLDRHRSRNRAVGARRARVTLLVSSGKPLVSVPDMTDVAPETAEADLTNAGLENGLGHRRSRRAPCRLAT